MSSDRLAQSLRGRVPALRRALQPFHFSFSLIAAVYFLEDSFSFFF